MERLYYNLDYNNSITTNVKKAGVTILVLIFLLGVAVLMDIRTNKVRNEWVLVLFADSIVLRFWEEGFTGLGIGLFHMLLAFLLLLPVFAFRALGAADIKILLSLSFYYPLQGMVFIFVSSMVIGAVVGIVMLVQTHLTAHVYRFHYIHFTIPILISVLLYEYGGVYELFVCNL